jgi:hypothetical protein
MNRICEDTNVRACMCVCVCARAFVCVCVYIYTYIIMIYLLVKEFKKKHYMSCPEPSTLKSYTRL